MTAAATPDWEWLQEQLQALMLSNFNSGFDDLFAPNATGTVRGRNVDRARLRETLLVVQGRWNNDSVSFEPLDIQDTDEVGIHATWPLGTTEHWMSAIAATVQPEESRANRIMIQNLTLNGGQGLFRSGF